MDNLVSAVTLKALDGLTTRSIVTAENIANASTPGYRPLRVTFEAALRSAVQGGVSEVRDVQAMIEPDVDSQGTSPEGRLDLQLATASSTAMHYAALIEVVNRQMQIDGLAVARNA